MTRGSETLIANERIKGVSGVMTNLGTALFAAGTGRWFIAGADHWVSIWIVVAAMLIWSGRHALKLLEVEDGYE